ncbi:hypothetical protein B0A52_01452 [Exophiala mesophila]|uniref:Uncharacterized protein n=1 Tax=Exophiala mesophila TaxID=212818 RepID=A0A438NF09_EXOME|nr:hypothetical protein B0A52_01452 [Exophiala mesophila]
MSYENVSWLSEELPDWQHAIYHMDDPNAELHPPSNKGREAMAYLTYLIDHYDVLPEINAEDYDNVISAQSLQLNHVQQHGYVNMRCIAVPGCPDEIQPFRVHPDRPYEVAFGEAYKYMFQFQEHKS